jgi:tryptophan synthase alpha chain
MPIEVHTVASNRHRRNRLRARLELAAVEQRGLLIGFLPGGFPDPQRFLAAAHTAFRSGLDALEVSLPGPAPEIDGPLIQEAAAIAAEYFGDFREGLALAAAAREHDDDVIIALAYAHHIASIGIAPLLDAIAEAGVDALLMPQQTVAEQLVIGAAARELNIEPVIFLHLEEDLETLCASDFEHPFIYLQSADLHTGGRFNPAKAQERLAELRDAVGSKPYSVAVGFGIRGADEVNTVVRAGADGAIIGTRLVAAAQESTDEVAELIDGIRPSLFLQEDQNS